MVIFINLGIGEFNPGDSGSFKIWEFLSRGLGNFSFPGFLKMGIFRDEDFFSWDWISHQKSHLCL